MESLEKKTRRKLNNLQSGLVCEIYDEYGGKWDNIMRDERIEALGYSREYLSTHIANRKKYKRRKMRDNRNFTKKRRIDKEEEETGDSEISEINKESRNAMILKVLKHWIEEENGSDELRSRQTILESKIDQLQVSLDEILMLLKK